MLNKKNIAKIMATATVAASVAPVFAAETVVTETVKKGSDEQKALVNDLRKLLNEGTKFEVEHTNAEGISSAPITVGESVYAIGYRENNTTDGTIIFVNNILELEKEIEAIGDDKLLNVVVFDKGHAIVNGKVSPVNANEQDIDPEQLAEITVENMVSVVGEYKVEDLYDGEYVTEAGFDLVDLVANKNWDKKKYTKITSIVSDVTKLNKELFITIGFEVDYVDTDKATENFTIKISGTDLKHINDLHSYLKDGGDKVGATKIVGTDRFATAVAIANEKYNNVTTDSIVLVNGTSMIDGLTAAPLAEALNAAVLLTNKDSLPQSTLSYITKAAAKGNAKVTIVGGTSVVSDTVKRQLETMGVSVERIGGKDRHSTSVEVAVKLEKLAGTKLENAFIVAATGEADAMSIAPEAARLEAPIIVEGFDGMSTTANELLKSAQNIDVIGGKVSEETKEIYKKRTGYDFVAGEDRFETNAKIIRNYFKNSENVYVTKDGFTENNNEALVDALAVGTLANERKAAIVLASEELSTKQKEAVELAVAKDTTKNVITQVGGGVKHSAIKQIAKLLGYTK